MITDNIRNTLVKLLKAEGLDQISNDPPEKKKDYPFILSLSFPNTYQTCYFYKYESDLLVDFIGASKNWKGIRVSTKELKKFIKDFLAPSKLLETLGSAAFSTWTRERSDNVLIFTAPEAKRFKYYIGFFRSEAYSDLHHYFIGSGFLTQYVFNEAGLTGSVWGAAQYRTLYTTSILNYEGVDVNNGKTFLYYISGSYIPSVFNDERIISEKKEKRLVLPSDWPADLAGAIENIPIKKIYTEEQLYERIVKGKNKKLYVEALYHMTTPETFKEYFTKILDLNIPEINNIAAYKASLYKDKDVAKKAVKKGISPEAKKALKDEGLLQK